MRIQEMRSGLSYLRRKTRERAGFDRSPWNTVVAVSEPVAQPSVTCELDQPVWTVVSFSQIEAGGMTYAQASKLMSELDSYGVAGLCITTDKAASRISR